MPRTEGNLGIVRGGDSILFRVSGLGFRGDGIP